MILWKISGLIIVMVSIVLYIYNIIEYDKETEELKEEK